MPLSDLIAARIQSACHAYSEGAPGLHDSRGDTYQAINVVTTTGSKTDEDLATDLAEKIISALHITPETDVEWLVQPRTTVRGPNTLCYARMSARLVQ